MFTGIVEELGRVRSRQGGRFEFDAPVVTEDSKLGDSIAVNGCCLTVVDVTAAPNLRIRCPKGLLRYIIEKGSITVRGCSLTVVEPLSDGFTVAVIPHTAEVTTLGYKGPGDGVNLEVDMMAKYIERLLEERG